MSGSGQDLYSGSDLLVAVDDSLSGGFDVRPLGDGAVRSLRCDEFGRLDIDRYQRQGVVLAAVIEVQMAVHDRGDVAFIDADPSWAQ